MSNKVQVIFTFELVGRERKEVQGGGRDYGWCFV